ncbi:hypothetical protein BC830DRAFT_1117983 [Chytriomyces sp. MP71]|nr:hypothetical protein BC830DRAFT_1117983 [Chytriomyces sp. MP71]
MTAFQIDGRNILLTGGAGFIGSHVVHLIATRFPSSSIYTMDRLDYCSSENNLASVANLPNHHFIKGDITSADFVSYIISHHDIDTIMHFAAQSHVDNSFGDSFEFTKNNVLGTHVLLEAARQHQVLRFIHVSTDEVYGEVDRGSPHCTEDTILAPTNPYAATKAAAESLVMAYFKSFKLPVIITRSNNIYGPHQYPEKIIPKFICSLLNNQKCYIHGNGSNSRHYLHATDIAAAMVVILEKGVVGETYNIGSDVELSNIQLFRYLLLRLQMHGVKSTQMVPGAPPPLSVLGDTAGLGQPLEGEEAYLDFVEDRPFNDRRYAIDSSKLQRLGWKPTVSFEDGIQKTIDWYREHWSNWWDEDVVATSLVAHPSKVIVRSILNARQGTE